MRRLIALLVTLALCVGLCGCNFWMDGDYVSIESHPQQYVHMVADDLQASSYAHFVEALKKLVAEGLDSGIIFYTDMAPEVASSYMETAIEDVMTTDPVCVYAVDEIHFDLGKNSGRDAVAVTMTYVKNRSELLRIQYVEDMTQAEEVVCEALKQCRASVAFRVEQYQDVDLPAIVCSCTQQNPEYIMEQPLVMAAVYPETGDARLVELVFTYQTDRTTLTQMQELVYPVFFSAELYVQGDAPASQKYARLYNFLMERTDYRFEASATPTYSLIQDGIGDSSAFACVYARMCSMADLECYIVEGTRNGEPWTWNMVRVGDNYAYVDLIRSYEARSFHLRTESEMYGYEWDRDAVRPDAGQPDTP